MERFIEQARRDYLGTPTRIAVGFDKYGEEHVVIEMAQAGSNPPMYLDWIGGKFASEPDEMEEPPLAGMRWKKIAQK